MSYLNGYMLLVVKKQTNTALGILCRKMLLVLVQVLVLLYTHTS